MAAEGYRALSADTGAFAEAAAVVGAETWPGWHMNAGEAADG